MQLFLHRRKFEKYANLYTALLLSEEAKLSTTDKSDKTKIPIKRYVVRGCYNQLTGQTPSKFMITTDYCFKSKISTIWNYDGTKPWLLSDGTDPTTTEYIRLCKDNTCNSKSVENGNDPCIAPSTGPPIVVGDTTTSPINTKGQTVASDC